MAYKATYHEDSDADDEFERSVFVSPNIPQDLSPSDSDLTSPEHTPTTFTHSHSAGSHTSPTSLITEWSPKQCADYLAGLGLAQYSDALIDEAINGEVLIALQHQELKEMGMNSVGHRLTVLKGVYDIKVKQNIPIDPDHYIPLSAEGNNNDMSATQDDIARVIESIRLRDQRIISAESELRAMKEDIHRLMDENRKLREEMLPVVRIVKDRSHPLPTPEPPLSTPPADARAEKMGSSLSRKFSTKRLFLGSAPKNPSPTVGQPIQDSASLDPSAAALAASAHMASSIPSQNSPIQIQQLSPTSPAYSMTTSTSRSFAQAPNSARSQTQTTPHEEHHPSYSSASSTSHWPGTTPDRPTANGAPTRRTTAQTLATTASEEPPPTSAPLTSTTSNTTSSTPHRDKDKDNIEIFKSFRVGIEDPCHKVLPVALKRYQINDDWRQYALYIVHGDQERCLGLEEKPLMLFKQLDREGRKPMFMLRKHAAPTGEGWSSGPGGSTGGNTGGTGGGGNKDGRGLPGGII